jgi:hypothetical protein
MQELRSTRWVDRSAAFARLVVATKENLNGLKRARHNFKPVEKYYPTVLPAADLLHQKTGTLLHQLQIGGRSLLGAGAAGVTLLRENSRIAPPVDFCVTIGEGHAVGLIMINGGLITPPACKCAGCR